MISELETALLAVRDHEGVEQVLLLGRDGLAIRSVGSNGLDTETVAAVVPPLLASADMLGDAAERGHARTLVTEYGPGVAIVAPLSDELLLAVLVRPDVGFAPLLATLRRDRDRLATLV
jgi:predicted regulator of Ras-like GTPase activity (Roadblock/LC7/MglB family)